MDDDPLPPEIVWILDRALNPIEAAHLLNLYRVHGSEAAVHKGLWLNKNRSRQGREYWREYQRRRSIFQCRTRAWRQNAEGALSGERNAEGALSGERNNEHA